MSDPVEISDFPDELIMLLVERGRDLICRSLSIEYTPGEPLSSAVIESLPEDTFKFDGLDHLTPEELRSFDYAVLKGAEKYEEV